jgi:hypothetical protein
MHIVVLWSVLACGACGVHAPCVRMHLAHTLLCCQHYTGMHTIRHLHACMHACAPHHNTHTHIHTRGTQMHAHTRDMACGGQRAHAPPHLQRAGPPAAVNRATTGPSHLHGWRKAGQVQRVLHKVNEQLLRCLRLGNAHESQRLTMLQNRCRFPFNSGLRSAATFNAHILANAQ